MNRGCQLPVGGFDTTTVLLAAKFLTCPERSRPRRSSIGCVSSAATSTETNDSRTNDLAVASSLVSNAWPINKPGNPHSPFYAARHLAISGC